jgi:hypothetical protein
MEHELRPVVDKFDIHTGGDAGIVITVKGLKRCANGNFQSSVVVLRKKNRTFQLTWAEWEALATARHGVTQANRILGAMGGAWPTR